MKKRKRIKLIILIDMANEEKLFGLSSLCCGLEDSRHEEHMREGEKNHVVVRWWAFLFLTYLDCEAHWA